MTSAASKIAEHHKSAAEHHEAAGSTLKGVAGLLDY